jgi:hypothetical protein
MELPVCHSTCFAFAMADLLPSPEEKSKAQNTACGSFFIAGCPFDRQAAERETEKIFTPPASPPTPRLPGSAYHDLNIAGISAPGGFDWNAMNVDTPALALQQCTDATTTSVCQTKSDQHAQFTLDFSTPVEVSRLQVFFADNFSPPTSPPSVPPPSPPVPPSPSPLGAPSQPPNPPPAPPCTPDGKRETCVIDLIMQVNNGKCQDGGRLPDGTMAPHGCALGTDFPDCPCRTIAGSDRLLSEQPDGAPGRHNPGQVDVYSSDDAAFLGYREGSFDLGRLESTSADVAVLYLQRRPARRYLSIRMRGEGKLRIRAIAAQSTQQPTEQPTLRSRRRMHSEEAPAAPETARGPPSEEVPADERVGGSGSRLAREMLRLTKECCAAGPAASAARARAAVLWAGLSDAESDRACTDCETRQPGSCHLFFWASRAQSSQEQETRAREGRRLKARRKMVEESFLAHLDAVCCAKNPNRPSEPETCDRRHCETLMRRNGLKRAAHSLRKLHERGHPALQSGMKPVQQMALDVIAPHLHPHEPCRVQAKQASVQQDCMFRSFAFHLSQKHGVEYSKIEHALNSVGVDVASAIKRGYDFWGSASASHGDARQKPPEEKKRPRSSRAGGGRQRVHRRAAEKEEAPQPELARLLVRSGVRSGGVQDASVAAQRAKNWSRGAAGYMRRLNAISRSKQGLATHNVDSETEMPMRVQGLSELSSVAALLSGDPDSLSGRLLGATRRLGEVAHGAGAAARKLRLGAGANSAPSARARRRTEVGVAPLEGSELRRALDQMFVRFSKADAEPRRRMQAQLWPSEPDWHEKHGAWVAALVDWRSVLPELRRFAKVDAARMHWWTDEANSARSPYPLSGIAALDVHVPPSTAGRLLRKLAHYVGEKSVPWESEPRRRSKLDQATTNPSRIYHSRSMGAGAVGTGIGPFDRMLERSYSTRRGTSRKLTETVFSSTLSVPYTAGDANTVWGGYDSKSGEAGYLEAVVRYVIYDVFLCYLYPNDAMISDTQLGQETKSSLGDGSDVKTHHTVRACFPTSEFALPRAFVLEHARGLSRLQSTAPPRGPTRCAD